MILDDIATYLAANSTRLTVGVNLTKGKMPDSPNTVTTVFETGGFTPVHFMSTGTQTRVFESPSFMVHGRSTDYQTVRDVMEDVFTILDGVNDTNLPTATGTYYQQITAVQSPFELNPDANDRVIFSVNFDVTKTTG